MTKTLPISVRLSPELNAEVAKLAAALDRPRSWVIEQAVTDYIAVQAWQLQAIAEGMRAADAGRIVPHDRVAAWVDSWDTDDEIPAPKCG